MNSLYSQINSIRQFPVNKGKIQSLGYQKRDIDDFISILKASQTNVIIDVRETPWSHKKGFTKTALSEQLEAHKIDYLHAKFAGNPKAIRKAAKDYESCLYNYLKYLEARPEIIAQIDEIIAPLLKMGKNVCFICYERHPFDCHRSILINKWINFSMADIKVEHLNVAHSERFTSFQKALVEVDV